MSVETGARIRLARKNQGSSQEALAQKVGVSKSNISKWETGNNNPLPENLDALAQALEVDRWWLVGQGERVPVARNQPAIPTGNHQEAALMGAISLDWGAALLAAKLVLASPEAARLSESQLADTLKRSYVVAVREPARLDETFVAGLALAQI